MGLNDAVIEQVMERVNRELVNAVRQTDWDDYSVLRVVVRRPEMNMGTPQVPDVDVYRYKNEAPPMSAHSDGRRTMEVFTITEPLIEHDEELREALSDEDLG